MKLRATVLLLVMAVAFVSNPGASAEVVRSDSKTYIAAPTSAKASGYDTGVILCEDALISETGISSPGVGGACFHINTQGHSVTIALDIEDETGQPVPAWWKQGNYAGVAGPDHPVAGSFCGSTEFWAKGTGDIGVYLGPSDVASEECDGIATRGTVTLTVSRP